jgi:hypothetical protein
VFSSFWTVSEGEFCEVRLRGPKPKELSYQPESVLRSSYRRSLWGAKNPSRRRLVLDYEEPVSVCKERNALQLLGVEAPPQVRVTYIYGVPLVFTAEVISSSVASSKLRASFPRLTSIW